MRAGTTQKLLVISVDAMHVEDISFARTLPGFAHILDRACVAEIEGIYPSLTYPNHAAQITGCAPARSGIYNNTQFRPGASPSEWFWDSRLLQVPTIFAAAQAAGLTTAAVQWPVTANEQHIDWLVPEIASPHLFPSVADQYRLTTNRQSFERYVLPHLDLVLPLGRKGRYLDFVDRVAPQILAEQRPDVMFVHLTALDFARHAEGAYGPHVEETLRRVDAALVSFLEVLEQTGDLERTNIVIVSDHGQIDVEQFTNLNALFAERGFLRTTEDGRLADYDVYCHDAGLSGQLFLAEDITPERRAEVERLLEELEADPRYRIDRIWTAAQTRHDYGLDGPFTWVVESEPGVMVTSGLNRRAVVVKGDEDFPPKKGAHGHAPRHGGQPVFIATGPGVVPGLDLGRRRMIDEAPTFAALLGIELPSADGEPMLDVLAPKPSRV